MYGFSCFTLSSYCLGVYISLFYWFFKRKIIYKNRQNDAKSASIYIEKSFFSMLLYDAVKHEYIHYGDTLSLWCVRIISYLAQISMVFNYLIYIILV